MQLYPLQYGRHPLYPQAEDFEVINVNELVGSGVISYRKFKAGEFIAKLAGDIISDVQQHSLQIDDGMHLLDLHFCGYFLHSCSPNVSLDMKGLIVTAVRNINPGDYLLMDYQETEKTLYKQFPCSCGSRKCRGWITGYNDPADEENPAYREFLNNRKVAL